MSRNSEQTKEGQGIQALAIVVAGTPASASTLGVVGGNVGLGGAFGGVGEFVQRGDCAGVTDRITVLRGARTKQGEKALVCKGFRGSKYQKEEMPPMYTARAEERELSGVVDLYELLKELRGDRGACVVRGKPLQGGQIRRLQTNFEDVPRRWLLVDLDGGELPAGFPSEPSGEDLLQAADYARQSYLPEWLSKASCVYAWTGSAGVLKGRGKGWEELRLRFGFWLDHFVSNEALRSYVRGLARETKVKLDAALYVSNQIHITSDPIFRIGSSDPLGGKERIGLLSGDPFAICPSDLFEEGDRSAGGGKKISDFEKNRSSGSLSKGSRRKARSEAERLGGSRLEWDATKETEYRAQRALDLAISEVEYAAKGCRHRTLYGQAYWIGRVVGGGYLMEREALEALESAGLRAMPEEKKDVERTVRDGMREGMRRPMEMKAVSKKKAVVRAKEEGTESVIECYARLSSQQERKPRTLEVPYLGVLPEASCVAVHSSLGTGKTEQAARIFHGGKSALWLAHRRALTRDTKKRLGQDAVLYLDQKDGRIEASKLILCVDSIGRCAIKPEVVVIDEADQVLQSLLKSGEGSDRRDSVLARIFKLSGVLASAKRVLMLSADMDDATVRAFLRLAGKRSDELEVVRHEWSHPKAAWRLFETAESLQTQVLSAWEGGRRLAVFCASRGECRTLGEMLRKARPEAKVGMLHNDSEDAEKATLLDVNREWQKWDAVLYTTTAGSGVSFDVKNHFDQVVVWGQSAPMDLPASEYLQGSARVRHPSSKEVWAYIPPRSRKERSRAELEADLVESEETTRKAIKELREAEMARYPDKEGEGLGEVVWQVYLDALESKEARTADPLKWLCKTLMSRGVPIYAEKQEISKKQKKELRKDREEAREGWETREAVRMEGAEDLTPMYADFLKGKELPREKALALKKHEYAAFYKGAEDATVPPASPTAAELLEDLDGQKRGALRRLVMGLAYLECPEYFAEKDLKDVVEDPRDGVSRVRSVVDARHYAGRGALYHDALEVICAAYPDLTSRLREWWFQEGSAQAEVAQAEGVGGTPGGATGRDSGVAVGSVVGAGAPPPQSQGGSFGPESCPVPDGGNALGESGGVVCGGASNASMKINKNKGLEASPDKEEGTPALVRSVDGQGEWTEELRRQRVERAIERMWSGSGRSGRLGIRGLSRDAGVEKTLGELCRWFGLSRTSRRLAGEGRVRVYALDMEGVSRLLEMGSAERDRMQKSLSEGVKPLEETPECAEKQERSDGVPKGWGETWLEFARAVGIRGLTSIEEVCRLAKDMFGRTLGNADALMMLEEDAVWF